MRSCKIKDRVITVVLLISLVVPVAQGGNQQKALSPAIRVTPPAPVFDDQARVAELAARRARVAEKIGPKGVLVLFSAEPRVYTNDVDYEYRQENNLYYLTNLKQKNATLVLMPGNDSLREILFLPRRRPAAETWTGRMYSPEEARRISGISEIWEAREFEPFIQALRAHKPYRPKSEALLMSAAAFTGSTQPLTPPVPKAAQAPTAATVATPARPVTGNAPPNLTTTNAPSTSQDSAQASSAQAASNSQTAATASTPTGYETLFAAADKGEASLFLLVPEGAGKAESREYKQEQRFAAQWAQEANGFTVRNAWPIFVEMRLRKSPMELQLLQHAIDITIEAQGRTMAIAGRSKWEYEVEADIEYTFKRRNAVPGYPSIVGSGPNATTLHYEESQGPIRQGDLLLMDVGAEYGHYSADITRTFPVNGRFTPAQADIYNVVLAAQDAGMNAIRVGATLSDVHNAALAVVKDGLFKLGLITDRNSLQYRLWFMHGTSHWLGMNVHDVGEGNAKFEPGMVFTVEPGIYIRGDALDYLPKTPENEKFIAAVRPAFEKYKNIGVRIEDDVVVTADGYKNLSAALPRTIPDIESFIARASREVRVADLEQRRFQNRYHSLYG